jgi:hypothetical protein
MRRNLYHKPVPFTTRSRNPWRGLVSPDETAYRNIPDLHAFCKAHRLDYALIYKLAQWEIDDVHGWKRLE